MVNRKLSKKFFFNGISLFSIEASLREKLDEVAKNSGQTVEMPDLTGLVTWDRLEDALRGIRESVEKSTHDAAAALASSMDRRPPVQLVERPSQTVIFPFKLRVKVDRSIF